ncbi:uncharacterized protein LOC125952131 isoform X1 [Anopheles darlingi]|uniref:uncharacterized protein LOC125952131 isoform X1 n=1 Tax=Anopheles darlingi TaxID=43151 RepID=UPI0021000B46|nr:uncharacterized protein LOC125952131 isoform X1 [Anopheles darlingi]XP_049537379.1 uncharacterized protein LOC125952131 isoform X1 [Anopheles darlingi]
MGDCGGRAGNSNSSPLIVTPSAAVVAPSTKHTASGGGSGVEHIECPLCWKLPRDPSHCPNCARQYCLQCITKWFGSKRAHGGAVECPNCEAKLSLDSLVQCSDDLDDGQSVSNGVQNGGVELITPNGHEDDAKRVVPLPGSKVADPDEVIRSKVNGVTVAPVETGTLRVVVKVLESEVKPSSSSSSSSSSSPSSSPGEAALHTPVANGCGSEKMLHGPVNGKQHGKRKDRSQVNAIPNGSPASPPTEKLLDTDVVKKENAPGENGRIKVKTLVPGAICNGVHLEEPPSLGAANQPTTTENGFKHGQSNGKGRRVRFEEPKTPRKNGYRKREDELEDGKTESVSSTVKELSLPVQPRDDPAIIAELPRQNGASIVETNALCNGDNLCTIHALPVLFFCLSCNGCICETCALHDDTHAEHTFKKITTMYDSKVEKIQHEFGGIKEYLADVGLVLRAIEQNIDWVRGSKARKLQELSQLLHTEAENIERQIQAKLTLLQRQKDAVSAEIARVTGAYRRLESELKTCPKPELLFKDDDFLQRCSRLIEAPVAKNFRHEHVPVDLDCEFVPEFRSEVFVVKNYHAIEPMDECRTSDVLRDVVGFGWRLHIWKSDHLSVTLIMTDGIDGRYEYCIELMHDDPAKAIRLTQVDHFELHQTGPVHDLIENEQLEVEGFLSELDDSLQIKFSVRPPTIVMVSRYQQEFIDRFMKNNINEYDSNVITICNIRDPTTSIVLSKQYTDTVGSRWRLNVYPKGNNTNQRYLSTYVELCDGIAGRYQYTVELLHDDVTRQVKFQSEDHFQVGEIRGYQKFIHVRRLLEEGYLSEDGSILIRLSIRPATLALRCQYQEEYQTLKEDKLRTQFNGQLNQLQSREKNLLDENASLQSLVYPEYASNIFVVRNFTALRQAQEDICSDNAYDDLGCCWRLIVYANGDKEGRDEWLSVYLRLLEGIPGSYEYCVELLHNDAAKTVKMEGTQSFDIQERFGWTRFARLDWICANGFVNEEHDALYFRFSLRPPNYKAKCEYQQLLRVEAKRECELLRRELIPAYSTMTYTLRNFSDMQRKDNFVYSDPLIDDLGFCWRLLIYPNGHSEGRGNHLTVYLVLFEGVSASRFEYRVELLHPGNPTANIKMEGVNVFKLKKIWGWPQFIHHERLQEEGYLDQTTDTLELRLSMCPPDIKLKCSYQQEFIRKLKENQK